MFKGGLGLLELGHSVRQVLLDALQRLLQLTNFRRLLRQLPLALAQSRLRLSRSRGGHVKTIINTHSTYKNYV